MHPAKAPLGAGAVRAFGSALLLAWFSYFAWRAPFNGFNSDDPMNIHGTFRAGWPEMIRHVVLFFEPSYRPMGGVLYKAVYDLFGYDPVPLQVAIVAVLLVNMFLVRRMGEFITGSVPAGFLCALAAAFHTRMAHVYYLPSFLYDVLCFAFYFSALNVYLAARTRDRLPGPGRLLAVLALYAAALGSKEIAVSLPVALLLYEALWHPPAGRQWSELARWARRQAGPALIAGAMTLVFIVGKATGPDALHLTEAYRPILTVTHILAEQSKYLNEILYLPLERPLLTPSRTLLLWASLLGAAALTRKRHLAWAAALAVVAPLPLAVLPGRGGAGLYLPSAFWALIAVTLFLGLCGAVSRLAAPPSARPVASVLLALAGTAAFARMIVTQNRDVPRAMAEPTFLGKHVAAEVRRVLPNPRRGARALYLNDLSQAFDTMFITELVWGDRTAQVRLQQHSHVPPGEFQGIDYLLEFAPDRTLRIVSSSGAASRESAQ